LPRLEKHRKAGTTLILSGILQGQEIAILRTARRLGWKLQRRGRLGRWHCLQFQPQNQYLSTSLKPAAIRTAVGRCAAQRFG
jgi:hypothetical protein